MRSKGVNLLARVVVRSRDPRTASELTGYGGWVHGEVIIRVLLVKIND